MLCMNIVYSLMEPCKRQPGYGIMKNVVSTIWLSKVKNIENFCQAKKVFCISSIPANMVKLDQIFCANNKLTREPSWDGSHKMIPKDTSERIEDANWICTIQDYDGLPTVRINN